MDYSVSNAPLKAYLSTSDRKSNDEHDICNPYSKITQLILYLYSMEIGSPPLYYEVNRVCRTRDYAKNLQTLGPFILALSIVTGIAESNKEPKD